MEKRNAEGQVVWGEYFIYSVNFTSLAVGSGVSYLDSEVRIDSDADFRFLRTMYFSTNDNADVRVKYLDNTGSKNLMKSGLGLRTVAGRSLSLDNSGSFDFRPYVWNMPYTIRRSSSFTVQAANANAFISPTVFISFHGEKLRPGIAPWKRPGIRKAQYTYTLPRNVQTNPEGVVTIAANQTVSLSLSIDQDSDFYVQKLTGGATGPALVTIQDGGRDRQWMNTATHIRNLVGSGAFPNNLPTGRIIGKGSVINITVQDLSGASNNVEINFGGQKLYGLGGR